jgi:hypothetical protein
MSLTINWLFFNEVIMHPVINLVNTRCTDGNHALLERWYADHVQLLLTSPQLINAQLHRCTHSLYGQATDYACAYEFASRENFELYEACAQRAQAAELTNAAAGRSAIEIIQRVQYRRLLHQRYAHAAARAPQGLMIQLHTTDAQPLATVRWLSDAVQQARSAMSVHSAQVMVSLDEPQRWQLHLGLGDCPVSQAWDVLQTLLAQNATYGQAPKEWQLQWAAASSPVMQWLR